MSRERECMAGLRVHLGGNGALRGRDDKPIFDR